MDRVMIIGGAGFIGSHLVDVCLAQANEVCVYDNFSTGRRDFLKMHPGLHVVVGDILETGDLSATLRQFNPDVVYHLAAIHHVPTCEQMPEHALRTNVVGTQSVLTACAQTGVPRLIFASTGAVYDVTDHALTESSPISATGIYAISKVAGEQLLQRYVAENGRAAVIARVFNAVGSHETNPHLVPDLLGQLAAGERVLRLGNLYPRRDYVHVQDLGEALFELGRHHLAGEIELFNVGSGREHSIPELVEILSSIIRKPLEIVSVPELQRRMDRASQLADISHIRTAIGWSPRLTLRDALSDAWSEQLQKVDPAQV